MTKHISGIFCGLAFLLIILGPGATRCPAAGLTYSVGDLVWEDLNANGVQEPGEPGIPGIKVDLIDSGRDRTLGTADDKVSTTYTDGTGNIGFYIFDNATPARPLKLRFEKPDGYLFSPACQGDDAGLDSNADVLTGETESFILYSDNLTVDAGLYRPAACGDFVWNDLNANGVQDAGEPGIPNITVNLLDHAGQIAATTTTGSAGLYAFTGLAPETYSVRFVPPAGSGYLFSPVGQGTPDTDSNADSATGTTSPITLCSGDNVTTIDAGLYLPSHLGGFVYDDTDNDGFFEPDESPIAGVTIALTGTDDLGNAVSATVVTDAAGRYVFDDLRPGVYTLTETQPADYLDGKDTLGTPGGTAGDDTFTNVVLAAGVCGENNNFGELRPASLSGYVYVDANDNGIREASEAPIEDVPVILTGTDDLGAISITVATDADGRYVFDNLRPGVYTLTETQPVGYLDGKDTLGTPGGIAGDDTFDNVVLTAGVRGENNDFGERWLPSSLGGVVYCDANNNGLFDAGETPIPGVTIALTGQDSSGNPVNRTTGTGSDGRYLFDDLRAGTYTISETQPAGYRDGTDTQGTPGTGTTMDDMFADITLGVGFDGTGNNFSELTAKPGIALTKTPDKPCTRPDETVTYTYVVTNSGQIPLTHIVVRDNNGTPQYAGDDFEVGTVATLLPGQSATLTAQVLLPVPMYLMIGERCILQVGTLITQVQPDGDIKAIYLHDPAVLDNTYGANARGYPRGGHGFQSLLCGDMAGFRFTDASGTVVLDFTVDYLSRSGQFPSGYGTLGVGGGDGKMKVGHPARVLSAETSLSTNLNQRSAFHGYTVNSPAMGSPKAAFWDYVAAYTVVVSKNAFGTRGFGQVTVPRIHVSSSKIRMADFTPVRCGATEPDDEDKCKDRCDRRCGKGRGCGTHAGYGTHAGCGGNHRGGHHKNKCHSMPPVCVTNTATATACAGDTHVNATATATVKISTECAPTPTPTPTPTLTPTPTPTPTPIPTPTPGRLATYTQGGWGSKPSGNNPGMLLKNHFTGIYPNGVTIGGKHTLKFTSAKAIQDFLPQGGGPGVLTASHVNPTKSLTVLAGQVLALQLNVDFSDAGVTPAGLGNVVLSSGKMAGTTIANVLKIANQVLGDAVSALPHGMSISDLNEVVAGINQKYDNGG